MYCQEDDQGNVLSFWANSIDVYNIIHVYTWTKSKCLQLRKYLTILCTQNVHKHCFCIFNNYKCEAVSDNFNILQFE